MTVLARVYLVRHGETDENRANIIQGQMDTLLNIVGLEQARLVGEVLRSVPFEIAFSSDLSRATTTAEAILAHHPDVAIQKQPELRERYMGDMQGKTVQTKLQAGSADQTIESSAFFAARAESWWIKYVLEGTVLLPEKGEPYHILVTSHGGFIGTLVRSLVHRRKTSCAPGVVVQRCLNSSVTIIEVDHRGLGVIVQFGETSHLKDLGRSTVEDNVDEVEVK